MSTMNLIHPTAEQTVLAAMLNQTPIGFSIAASDLSPDDFAAPQHKLIYTVLKQRLVTDEPIDPDTVAAEATNLASRLKMKTRVLASHVANLAQQDWKRADAYADTVQQMAVLRRAEKFANWFQQRIGEMPEPSELYAEAAEALRELQPAVAEDRFMPGPDTLRWHAALLNARRNTPEDEIRLTWPWASWNAFIRPLRSGQVALLSAPAGVGKTTYLEKISEHWAKEGYHVVLVHLENDLAYTLDRRLARHGRVTLDEIEAGVVDPDALDAAWHSVGAFEPRLHYLHAAGWSMERITAELAQLRAQGRCDAVAFDYMQKTRPSHTQRQFYGTDQWARQADDMEMLKTFCEMHGIAAIAAGQMNKSGNSDFGKKTRADVRGSQEVIDKAQLVVLVSREVADADVYDPKGDLICHAGDYMPDTLVQIVKQNSGRNGEITQIYVGRHFDVRDVFAGGN